jgi:hypothetical protein
MNLERRGGGLEHHVVVGGVQRHVTLDVDIQRAAVAQRHDPVVQGVVALHGRHVRGVQHGLLAPSAECRW